MNWPHTTYAWRRLKLVLAEWLVVTTAKGDHGPSYLARVMEAADAIREYRELYYPHPNRS